MENSLLRKEEDGEEDNDDDGTEFEKLHMLYKCSCHVEIGTWQDAKRQDLWRVL